tara:strand:+ start:338 stop:595 length:258 start_codon:yes stop_codon:yes gene_type:complete
MNDAATTQTESTMNDLITDAANLIAPYNRKLAAAWKASPFNRVSMAYAFAAGFAKNPSDDIHPTADIVIRIALLDRETRKLAMDL